MWGWSDLHTIDSVLALGLNFWSWKTRGGYPFDRRSYFKIHNFSCYEMNMQSAARSWRRKQVYHAVHFDTMGSVTMGKRFAGEVCSSYELLGNLVKVKRVCTENQWYFFSRYTNTLSNTHTLGTLSQATRLPRQQPVTTAVAALKRGLNHQTWSAVPSTAYKLLSSGAE